MNNEDIKKFMLFLGYEFIQIGYWGDKSKNFGETEWQRKNEAWIENNGLDSVGDYFVKVENDEFIDLHNNKWCEIIKINSDWNWIMKILQKAEVKQMMSIEITEAVKLCYSVV